MKTFEAHKVFDIASKYPELLPLPYKVLLEFAEDIRRDSGRIDAPDALSAQDRLTIDRLAFEWTDWSFATRITPLQKEFGPFLRRYNEFLKMVDDGDADNIIRKLLDLARDLVAEASDTTTREADDYMPAARAAYDFAYMLELMRSRPKIEHPKTVR